MKLASAALAALLLGGCVPLPPEDLPPGGAARPITREVFAGLDPGAKTLASLRFEVRAYGSDAASRASELSERLYGKVMADTGLYSFVPRGLYQVVIYGSQEEFLRKTGLPSWSGGVSVGNAIYTYDGPNLPGVLAHEMTHLVFHEYMGAPRPEHRWLNEGLAVFEEQEAMRELGRAVAGWSSAGGARPLPFAQMVALAPLSEDQRTAVSWYLQASAVVRFMIERGGRVGMAQLLSGLREGRGLDEAVRAAFPGIWDGVASLEAAWLRG